MDKPDAAVTQQIAQSAGTFEEQKTGHMPKSMTVVLSEDTLVITLHGALSPAEKALVQSPAGAGLMQEYHRRLLGNAGDALRLARSRPGRLTVT